MSPATDLAWILARFNERVGNPYVYAGVWSPTNPRQGCDCSALAAHVLNGVIYGPAMTWQRVDPASGQWITTEAWRPIEVGQRGPFGTITVARPQDIPADAAVKIALHHGPGGGAASHMWVEFAGVRGESAGSKGQVTGGRALAIESSYGNDWAYLPARAGGPVIVAPPQDIPADWLLVGSTGDRVARLQDGLKRVFPSYTAAVRVTGTFDAATDAAVREFQRRTHIEVDGIVGPQTREQLARFGIRPDARAAQPPPPPPPPPPPTPPARPVPVAVGYAVPGTWGVWNVGPQCMALNRNPDRVYLQGVGYNTGAFLNPDPTHSYVDALTEGTAELLRLALPDRRPKIVAGYSMGADVVARFLDRWPADRRDEIRAVFTFGSPCRPPGPTKLGPAIGAGISGFYTPEWARDREWSYVIDGDMYPEAVGLLPALYDILTRMEVSADFALYLFGVLTSTVGPALLGIAGTAVPGFGALAGILRLVTAGRLDASDGPVDLMTMLLNLPAIVATLVAALKFVFTGAHGRYWVDKVFDGMTAEDHAASIVAGLSL